jgi:hypothetical protein
MPESQQPRPNLGPGAGPKIDNQAVNHEPRVVLFECHVGRGRMGGDFLIKIWSSVGNLGNFVAFARHTYFVSWGFQYTPDNLAYLRFHAFQNDAFRSDPPIDLSINPLYQDCTGLIWSIHYSGEPDTVIY